MYFQKQVTIAVFVVAGIVLSGCTSSGISTHANAVDHKDTRYYRNQSERGIERYRKPGSDHVSLKGDKSKAFLAAGQEHFTAQNYGLAEQNFRKAVEARSDNASAWLGLAASLDQLGRFEFSDRAYDQLVQLENNNARVLNNMGYSYLLRGDYQKARRYLDRAQNLDPGLEEVQGNIHLLEKTINS